MFIQFFQIIKSNTKKIYKYDFIPSIAFHASKVKMISDYDLNDEGDRALKKLFLHSTGKENAKNNKSKDLEDINSQENGN